MIEACRFARAEKISPLTAQALRRITSEGSTSSTASSTYDSMIGSSGSIPFRSASSIHTRFNSRINSQCASYIYLQDGSSNSPPMTPSSLNPLLDKIGMHIGEHARLSRSTKKRRFPGYPSPRSPSADAKVWFPSPSSECPSGQVTHRPATPMSVDGSSMCGPSYRCNSHSYSRYDNIHEACAASSVRCSSTTSPTPASPASPGRVMSPRTAMLKNKVDKHIFPSLFNNPSIYQPNPASAGDPLALSVALPSLSSWSNILSLSTECISMPHGGYETIVISPMTPSGTMLSYRSNRSVDSGLLAVKPLSESQVAEYRFWQPCGRMACGIGCGGIDVGERTAARRLFRDEEVIREECEEAEDKGEYDKLEAYSEDQREKKMERWEYTGDGRSWEAPITMKY
jgi:hypothetical protein